MTRRPDPDPAVRHRLAETVPASALDAAVDAYREASLAGLCAEGAWEVALGVATTRDDMTRDDAPLNRPR